jgi:hypothetical protein
MIHALYVNRHGIIKSLEFVTSRFPPFIYKKGGVIKTVEE